MKYSEVANALKAGKKIKLVAWKKAYWYQNEKGEIINHFEDGGEVPSAVLFPRDLLWVMNGNWEVVEDDESKNVNKPVSEMKKLRNFGWAIAALKRGEKVSRKGWNGKKQYIQLASGISYVTSDGKIVNCEHDAIGNQAIAFVDTSGVQMGWLASQADMLAEDWTYAEV